ncbi:MAG: methyl-accepting chemotaxis protein, partial [Rhodospirillaceae bacterium]
AGAAQQAASLEQVREAIRMSAEAITKVSVSATAAREVSDEANGLSNRGQITVAEMADLMEASFRTNQELLKLSQTLGHTVSKVDYLAATVAGEAFKLGEPGRDFAGLCQQVCTLTKETHESAGKICGLVEAVNRDLQAGSVAAGTARTLITDIRQRVADTDTMIGSIAETMLAQQSAITEIDATANSLAEIGEHNVEAGEQISRRLVELRDISNATKAAIAAFKIETPAPKADQA